MLDIIQTLNEWIWYSLFLMTGVVVWIVVLIVIVREAFDILSEISNEE